jgi:hypothetical protein
VNPAATIIINVDGDTLRCGNMDLGNSYNQRRVLWNFCSTSTLTLYNVLWKGSVLAPFTDFRNCTGTLRAQGISNGTRHLTLCFQVKLLAKSLANLGLLKVSACNKTGNHSKAVFLTIVTTLSLDHIALLNKPLGTDNAALKREVSVNARSRRGRK